MTGCAVVADTSEIPGGASAHRPAGSGVERLLAHLKDPGGVSGDPGSETGPGPEASGDADPYAAHSKLFTETRFPSATTCRTCHPRHYREWSVSQHSYAQLSPVFNAMQATVIKLTNGSNGDFCIRCHTQIGMTLGEPAVMSNMDRSAISREGVTCVVCHRMEAAYGKINGRMALAEGDILTPVNGPTGHAELRRVLNAPEDYRVTTDPNASAGRRVHGDARKFEQISTAGFCGSCHDVTLPNGFRLEEAFSQFKNSPAAADGESCQDCHMGKVPGRPSGFDIGPAAIVGGVPTRPRKVTNHMFAGPDHSIIHPGLFPHNPRATDLATMREWLTFDHAAGWGTDAFEAGVRETDSFPDRWKSVDDRYDARAVIDEQAILLAEMREQRIALLRQGYKLGALKITRADTRGLRFEVEVRNGTDGHSVPTGFDAERLVFLRVQVRDGSSGHVLFESGDLDPNGDVRDLHSEYVRDGKLPLDKFLFSLQSKIIATNIRGGEREEILAVNRSVDPLPFIRPEPFSTILSGRPRGLRIHRRGIPPNSSRWAEYEIKRRMLRGVESCEIHIQLIAAMVPVNLISEIEMAGFDYHMTARDVATGIVDGHLTLWEHTATAKLNGETGIVELALDRVPDHEDKLNMAETASPSGATR